MPAFIDRTGRQYGRLTVIGLSERKTNNGRKLWLCECRCGNRCEVRGSDLTMGRVLSCGCFRKESVKRRKTKHGKSKNNRLYQTWQNMKRRCNDASNIEYHCYGGKGVKVCDDWNNSYESFERWAIESGYCEPLTIDRIDSNGDYSPYNCQWLTKSENSKKMHRERGHNVGTA